MVTAPSPFYFYIRAPVKMSTTANMISFVIRFTPVPANKIYRKTRIERAILLTYIHLYFLAFSLYCYKHDNSLQLSTAYNTIA
jgi:hypothetical protein